MENRQNGGRSRCDEIDGKTSQVAMQPLVSDPSCDATSGVLNRY